MCFFRPYMAKNQRPKIVEIVLIKSWNCWMLKTWYCWMFISWKFHWKLCWKRVETVDKKLKIKLRSWKIKPRPKRAGSCVLACPCNGDVCGIICAAVPRPRGVCYAVLGLLIIISCKAEHPRKAVLSIDVTDAGISIFCTLEHPKNEIPPIVSTLPGNFIVPSSDGQL
jgi:hypothetical protein